ncbi:MAG TPA: LuxR C-terminal-related transcriptional regulator [Chryseosolibacter sp.]
MKIAISSKELEILRKSAEGVSLQQIADELHLPQQIISKSQKEILSRAGVTSSVNALQALAKRGFTITEERREFTAQRIR